MPLLGIAVYKNRSLGTAVYRLFETHFPMLFHIVSALSAPFGHLPLEGNAIKLSKILIAHASNSVCFFHPLSLLVNNKIKKLVK